jgi:hypothetical protein
VPTRITSRLAPVGALTVHEAGMVADWRLRWRTVSIGLVSSAQWFQQGAKLENVTTKLDFLVEELACGS